MIRSDNFIDRCTNRLRRLGLPSRLFTAFKRPTMTLLTLETPRLIMTQIRQEDWPFFHALHRAPDVLRFITDPLSDEDLERRFTCRLPTWSKDSDQWLCLTVQEKESGNKIGMSVFKPLWHPSQQAEIGYLFFPEWQGRGYALEATRAVIEFGFVTCGFHKLNATVTAGNEASVKLLGKAGFVQEGCLRENFKLGGKWYDDLRFGLLAADRRL
jgi:RimJ/RimL family protein N-acetyltransferase